MFKHTMPISFIVYFCFVFGIYIEPYIYLDSRTCTLDIHYHRLQLEATTVCICFNLFYHTKYLYPQIQDVQASLLLNLLQFSRLHHVSQTVK